VTGSSVCCLFQASYALGYNLAIEYLADYEKTWMLDSFRDLNSRVLNKDIDWIFLEVGTEAGIRRGKMVVTVDNRLHALLQWLQWKRPDLFVLCFAGVCCVSAGVEAGWAMMDNIIDCIWCSLCLA